MSAAPEGQPGLADAWMRGVESGDAREAGISRSATCVAAWCLLDVALLMAPERHRGRGRCRGPGAATGIRAWRRGPAPVAATGATRGRPSADAARCGGRTARPRRRP